MGVTAMKRNILCILLLFGIVVCMTGCNINNIFKTEEEKNDEKCQQIIMAIENHDADALKGLFSETALHETSDFSEGCDYLCGQWLGTLENLDVTGVFKHPQEIESIGIGLLSHHRSGIVFPEYIALFTGSDEAHLSLKETMHIPNAPCEKEIVKKDFVFSVKESIGCFRIIVHRYAKMPQWCTYKGVCDVFTLADHLIIKPKEK